MTEFVSLYTGAELDVQVNVYSILVSLRTKSKILRLPCKDRKIPEADRDEVRRLADLLVHREPGLRDVPAAGIEAAMTLFGYYADLLAEEATAPGRRPRQRAARRRGRRRPDDRPGDHRASCS